MPRRGYVMYPVDTTCLRVAKHEDVAVLRPHPAMGDYRRVVVVVVADDQVLGESAVKTPSGLGEGLAYLYSPNGKHVAFATKQDNNFEVYEMKADGSDPTNLTKNPALDGEPAY